jgi:hypothetical protein
MRPNKALQLSRRGGGIWPGRLFATYVRLAAYAQGGLKGTTQHSGSDPGSGS